MPGEFSGSGLSRKPVIYSLSSCFFEFLRNLGAFPLVLADLRAVIGLFLFKMCSRHCSPDVFVYTHMVNICIKDQLPGLWLRFKPCSWLASYCASLDCYIYLRSANSLAMRHSLFVNILSFIGFPYLYGSFSNWLLNFYYYKFICYSQQSWQLS